MQNIELSLYFPTMGYAMEIANVYQVNDELICLVDIIGSGSFAAADTLYSRKIVYTGSQKDLPLKIYILADKFFKESSRSFQELIKLTWDPLYYNKVIKDCAGHPNSTNAHCSDTFLNRLHPDTVDEVRQKSKSQRSNADININVISSLDEIVEFENVHNQSIRELNPTFLECCSLQWGRESNTCFSSKWNSNLSEELESYFTSNGIKVNQIYQYEEAINIADLKSITKTQQSKKSEQYSYADAFFSYILKSAANLVEDCPSYFPKNALVANIPPYRNTCFINTSTAYGNYLAIAASPTSFTQIAAPTSYLA